jgi:hypothetical protein
MQSHSAAELGPAMNFFVHDDQIRDEGSAAIGRICGTGPMAACHQRE